MTRKITVGKKAPKIKVGGKIKKRIPAYSKNRIMRLKTGKSKIARKRDSKGRFKKC